MTAPRSRRAALIAPWLAAAACTCLGLLAGCGSSSTESELVPTRFIAFGDSFADVGQSGGRKYTVNDSSVNHWLQKFAAGYGRSITASSAGGLGYAQGMARIATSPDAAGNASTLNVTQQIDAFLASQQLQDNDLLVVSGGVGDIIFEINAMQAGSQTEADMTTHLKQAGVALAAQIKRLLAVGAKHIAVVGAYNLGKTPWGTALDKKTVLTDATSHFNEALLVALNDLGEKVLYIDAAYYMNLLSDPLSAPGYAISNVVDPVCTSVDAGAGIGTGSGQVNALLCDTTTLLAGADDTKYAFADRIHFTPAAQRLFGDYAYSRLRARW